MSVALLAFLAAMGVPDGRPFACTPVRVWDGDGPIWCAEGPRIRLAGIAAREMDETCLPGHPCPEASAAQAKATLVRLIGRQVGQSEEGHALVLGPTLFCQSNGGAGGVRTAAWCSSPSLGDLSCAMLAAKMVARWDRYWGETKMLLGRRCYGVLMTAGLMASPLPMAASLSAHPGGLAADGCHNDRKNGGRHCHRRSSSARQAAPSRQQFASSRSVYFSNCSEARAAGAAPVRRGDPGYASHLDRDSDGVGCE